MIIIKPRPASAAAGLPSACLFPYPRRRYGSDADAVSDRHAVAHYHGSDSAWRAAPAFLVGSCD
jgi:hypothetical protein